MPHFDLEYYLEKRRKGVPFSEIRTELKTKGFDEFEIKLHIKELDDAELETATTKSYKGSAKVFMYMGIGLMTLGIGITYFTKQLNYSQYIMAYGPAVAGIFLYMYGRTNLKKAKK
ncbi:hypothetical protein R9C00_27380 [Flammeovirgaceae bacterium SG7u.111]|nr:hypothetical protein [Flammeovirgaceae bacterium SG7u.132]WPO35423.1 hypothetical protein R9C00_27380 [Flammeovirgaceae bacterium SG7u.111]